MRVIGPQFGETVHISEANRARKIKSDAHVAMNKNSYPVQQYFLVKGSWGGRWPKLYFSKLIELSETSRARKLIFGLQVNIDKANSRGYDFTR